MYEKSVVEWYRLVMIELSLILAILFVGKLVVEVNVVVLGISRCGWVCVSLKQAVLPSHFSVASFVMFVKLMEEK